ncbi:MAG: ATP-binding cassette domain-containing protein [Acidobacteria bacterium]|nr:ATP-binding cassette domain-containing protein [Acidobacteriota bacterium]
MPLLTLDSASLAFGHLPLFDGASLRIDAGERIALIGRNGSGKSSLLKAIAGELLLDGGTIWRAPGLRVSRLDQDVPLTGTRTVFEEVSMGLGELGALAAAYHRAVATLADSSGAEHDAALERLGDLQHQLEERDGWSLEQKAELVISRLSLPADRPVGELSGGWRRRALLGKALVSEPDLLLLDEPTNHLDIDAIRWLEEHLSTFAGALLFVTHDRAFLSRLALRIVELDRGTLSSWPGTYASYLEKKAAALENEARDLARLDKKLAQEEVWIRQGVKARRTRNEGRVKDLIALRATRAAYREQSGSVRMSIDGGESSGRVVFEAENVSKTFEGEPVISGFSQRILRGDRIGLIGPNGSGKTTLLRLLVGELEPDTGTIRRGTRLRVAYYDQQREQLNPDRTVADSVNEGNSTVIVNGQPRHIMGYLADFLFPRERALSPVKSLSGGERNRLLLARLFARPANVLVLDEPTNDLDIETLELLEELIGDFDGTVLLVSHDRVFLDRIVTSTLAFEGNGRVTEYVGGWHDYLRQTSSSRSSGLSAPKAAEPRTPSPEPLSPGKRKLSFKEQRELEALPERIAALETELATLRAESESSEFYKAGGDRIRAVLARIDDAARELESSVARWMELEERR